MDGSKVDRLGTRTAEDNVRVLIVSRWHNTATVTIGHLRYTVSAAGAGYQGKSILELRGFARSVQK